jgi:hypothetical protein
MLLSSSTIRKTLFESFPALRARVLYGQVNSHQTCRRM